METYFFYGTGKELTKIIKMILNRNLATEVIRENYLASYSLKNGKTEKKQIKKIYIIGTEKGLEEVLMKNNKFIKGK